jgi:hypothetical protein
MSTTQIVAVVLMLVFVGLYLTRRRSRMDREDRD